MDENLMVRVLEAASSTSGNSQKDWDPLVAEGYTQDEVMDAVEVLRGMSG